MTGTGLFSIAGLLALVACLPPLARRLGLPLPVLLALVGTAIGMAARSGLGLDNALIGDWLRGLVSVTLDPGWFLFFFLPALLFQSALSLDYRDILDDLGPIVLLAVVAVFVTTLAVGYGLAWTTGVSLALALLLGAVVATTDPVAVIAVFRDVGAPGRLRTIVEGESLLNDAAAIVLATLFLSILTGEAQADLLRGTLGFFAQFIGGAAIGLIGGLIASSLAFALMRQRDALATLSVALCYLVYFLANDVAKVSGIVAVVMAGLVFGGRLRVRWDQRAAGDVLMIWDQLAFWSSVLIIVLASIRIPGALYQVGPAIIPGLAVTVIATLAARAAILWGLLPAMHLLGLANAVDHRYRAVMLWGGMRGAVTLVLALALGSSSTVSVEDQAYLAALASAYVLFTLIVQGTSLRWLIRALGLNRLSPQERAMRARVLAMTRGEIRERLAHTAAAYRLDDDTLADVRADYDDRENLPARRDRAGKSTAARADAATVVTAAPDDDLGFALSVTTRRELSIYGELLGEQTLSRPAALHLLRKTGELLDSLRARGVPGYLRAARAQLGFTWLFRWALWFHVKLHLHWPLAERLALRFEVLIARGRVLRELRSYAESRLVPLLSARSARRLRAILTARLDEDEKALEALRLQYPDYAAAIARRYLARAAVRMEEAAIEALEGEGVIGGELARDLRRDSGKRRRTVSTPLSLDLQMEVEDMMAEVPLFAELDARERHALAGRLRPRLVTPGEVIIRRGEVGDSAYFIVSGALEVFFSAQKRIRLGSGQVVGEIALMTGAPRVATVRSLGFSRLLVLTRHDLDRVAAPKGKLKRHLHDVAATRRAENVP